MTITSDNVEREVLTWSDLSETEREEFAYLSANGGQEDASFFRYDDWTYDMGEFERVTEQQPSLTGWVGYSADSAFSAVLIRYVRDEYGGTDSDHVVVGRYYDNS